jgi:hypothetical protein
MNNHQKSTFYQFDKSLISTVSSGWLIIIEEVSRPKYSLIGRLLTVNTPLPFVIVFKALISIQIMIKNPQFAGFLMSVILVRPLHKYE